MTPNAPEIDGLLLDMDGVLTVSWEPIAGALDAVSRLRLLGIPFRVMTNTTSDSRASIAERLRRAGFDISTDEVLTSAIATAAYLREHHPKARCYLLGEPGSVMDDMQGVDWVERDADVVVIGGADDAYTFDNINLAFRMVVRGAALVAMHRNLSWMTAEGICLDAGAYLLGIEQAAGVAAVVTGKPAPAFLESGRHALGLPAERVAMVGDDVETDVLAAQALGMTGILVRTGKFMPDTLARAKGAPHHVVDSVADVPGLVRDLST